MHALIAYLVATMTTALAMMDCDDGTIAQHNFARGQYDVARSVLVSIDPHNSIL